MAPFLTFIHEFTTKRGISFDDTILSKPNNSDSHSLEVACYGLPYGGLGFLSHILTYYTLTCLWFGRRPLWPFRAVSCSIIDLLLGSISLGVTIGMAIITMIHCKNSWQLVAIAIWQMSMSLLNGITTIHVAALVMKSSMKKRKLEKEKEKEKEERENKKGEKSGNEIDGSPAVERNQTRGNPTRSAEVEPKVEQPNTTVAALWIILYFPGMIAGVAGLMSLVVKQFHSNKPLRILTICFYSLMGVFPFGISISISGNGAGLLSLAIPVAIFSIFSPFYSDWALGLMARKIGGLPSSDNSLFYWVYWFAKRLPMFSW